MLHEGSEPYKHNAKPRQILNAACDSSLFGTRHTASNRSMASALIVGLRHMRHGGASHTASLLCLQPQHLNASAQLLPSSLRIVRALSSLPTMRRSPLLLQRTAPNALGVMMDFQQRFSSSSSSGAGASGSKRPSSSAGVPPPPPIPTLASLDKERVPATAATPDAFKLEKDTWAERHCPQWMVPYIQLSRVNRPAGKRIIVCISVNSNGSNYRTSATIK